MAQSQRLVNSLIASKVKQNRNGYGIMPNLFSHEITDENNRTVRCEWLASKMMGIVTIFPPEGQAGPEEEIRITPEADISEHKQQRLDQVAKLLEMEYGCE